MSDLSLSIKDIAARYSISVSTVRRLVSSGTLQPYRVGNQLRFDKKEVEKTFRGANQERTRIEQNREKRPRPGWAEPVIAKWHNFVVQQIQQIKPDHIILLDRRGAKIWSTYLGQEGFEWGKSLWHSNALTCMTVKESVSTFRHKTVVIFDEMMQRGGQLSASKEHLKWLGASVQSIVLFRRRRFFENGKLQDPDARICEDLRDEDFSIRAAHISSLLKRSDPPLDVDHLVVKGTCGLTATNLLRKLSDWGLPYIVWVPDREDGSEGVIAISLDRPQFFETKPRGDRNDLKKRWNEPCKLRLYLAPESRACYCSFIAFPTLSAPEATWQRVYSEINEDSASVDDQLLIKSLYQGDPDRARNCVASREYAFLALNMFADFLASGAARNLEIEFYESAAKDSGELNATFGPSLGDHLRTQIAKIAAIWDSRDSRIRKAEYPPREQIRNRKRKSLSFDELSCRKDLLKEIPQYPEKPPPIIFDELYRKLSVYAESTIAKVLDHELDRGTAKPINWLTRKEINRRSNIELSRRFCRGEFDSYSGIGQVLTETDDKCRRTLGLCLDTMKLFLDLSNNRKLTNLQFSTIFVNLYHDFTDPKRPSLPPEEDMTPPEEGEGFVLTWIPNEFGRPMPVAAVDRARPELSLTDFLRTEDCVKIVGGGLILGNPERSYDDDWQGRPKSTARMLVRLYHALDRESLDDFSYGKNIANEFKNSLFILASARNPKTCYICCRANIETWIDQGNSLFQVPFEVDVTRVRLAAFQQPSQWISQYLEAYRVLVPRLRHRLLSLQKDLDGAGTVLKYMDEDVDNKHYPLPHIEEAKDMTERFSEFSRKIFDQILDDRTGAREKIKPDEIRWMVEHCPESGLENALTQAIDTGRGNTVRIEALNESFHKIVDWLLVKCPTAKPGEWIELTKQSELQGKLRTIQSNHESDCYALVVAACDKLLDQFEYPADKEFTYRSREICRIVQRRLSEEKGFYGPLEAQDMLLFGGTDPERTLRMITTLNKDFSTHLNNPLSLARWAVVWHEEKAEACDLSAVRLVKYMQRPGGVFITPRIYEKLTEKLKSRFVDWDGDKPQEFNQLYRSGE